MTRQDRWVDVPGARLWVAADGDGPPIVLLHAGIVDARVWEPFVPLLARERYRVVWFDARGYGRSATDDVEFRRVDDLLAVLDALGIRRAALVGNSLGGITALDLAVFHPDRVAALILLGAGIGGHEVAMSERDQAVEQRYIEVDATGDLEALTDFELALWGAGVEQPVERLPTELRASLRPMIRAANEDHVRGREVRPDGAVVDRLEQATMPIAFVRGSLDFDTLATYGEAIVERAPDARLIVWPDVAHMIAVERPEETARLILDVVGPLGDFR